MEEDTFNGQKPFFKKKGKIEWRHRDGGRKSQKCHICPECLSATSPDLLFHTSCQEISLTDANEYALSTAGGRRRRCSRNVSSNLPVSRSLRCRVKLNRRHETICSRSLGPSGLQILIVLNSYCRCENYPSLFQSCTGICSFIKALQNYSAL